MSVEVAELAGDGGPDCLRQERPSQSPAQQRYRSIHVFGDHAQRSPDDRERGTVRQQPQQHDSQQSPCVTERFVGSELQVGGVYGLVALIFRRLERHA